MFSYILGRIWPLALLLSEGYAFAKDNCDTAIEQVCSENPHSNGCFETLFSCGDYDRILASFTAKLEGLTAAEQYFAGVASLGIAERAAALSTRCAYNSQGKSALLAFLSRAQDSFHAKGDFSDAGYMRYVYHAEKMLRLANEQKACLENGHSQASINAYARTFSEKYLKSLFLEGMNSDSEPQRSYREIRLKLQGLVSSASNIETKLSLSGLEIDFANSQLTEIAGQLTQNVGEIKAGQLAFNTALLDSLDRNLDAPAQQVTQKEAEFKKAFTDCSDAKAAGSCADQYAKKKLQTISQAKTLMIQSTNLSQYLQTLFQSNQYHYQDFANLQGTSDQEMTASSLAMNARLQWQTYGDTKGLCKSPTNTYWYCPHVSKGK